MKRVLTMRERGATAAGSLFGRLEQTTAGGALQDSILTIL
jgi:hypothetical protein